MARLHAYKCEDCGLEALIAGGPSMLFAGYTNTYYCKECETLSDIVESEYPRLVEIENKINCPNCQSTRLIQ